MAVTSRSLHSTTPRRSAAKVYAARRPLVKFGILEQLWKPAATVALVYLTLLLASGQGRIWVDDLRYGRPRTMQISGAVGHNEANGEPTHFVAMNLNRRVVVIEMPGGDATKAQVLQGPYLFGADEDLTPVRLRLSDVNHDGKNDLVINVKNEEMIYVNSGDNFHLITAAERQQLGTQR